MTTTISKIGNSQGIIFDAALMDLARLKVGDQVNVTVMVTSLFATLATARSY